MLPADSAFPTIFTIIGIGYIPAQFDAISLPTDLFHHFRRKNIILIAADRAWTGSDPVSDLNNRRHCGIFAFPAEHQFNPPSESHTSATDNASRPARLPDI
jgi:hypothetical protein